MSDGGELATAICVNAPVCRVFWAVLNVQSLEEACDALRGREQIPKDRQDGVGVYISAGAGRGIIAEWASAHQVDAVIWTALPPRFENVEGLIPTVNDAISYLSNLTGDTLDHARNYITQVPQQIDTPYRREITQRLGWHD